MADKQTVKVGDKVRCLVTEFDVRKGELYEVLKVQDSGRVWFLDDVSDRFYLDVDEYELLPVAEATGKPAFKVGDRVRVLSDYLPWAHGGEIGTVQKVDKRDRDCFVKFETERMGDHTWYVRWDNLELAPSLTIETGKFYRTRDGRKVGPITCNGFGVYGSPEHPNHWYENGLSFSDNKQIPTDLIAEWVDEPNSDGNAPASIPAIVALIEGGQPKPSEQPKVHKSEQAATDEAERLAVKYPGQKFGVFVLADSRIADVVIRRAA